MTKKSERKKGILAIIALSAVFASMGVFARYLGTDLLLFQQVYLRVLAAFLFSLIFFAKDLHWSKIKLVSLREWSLLFFRAITMYGFGVTLFTSAILIAKYSNVSLIGALPMSGILGVFLFKETLGWRRALFILTAFAGAFIISVTDFTQISSSWGKGELLTFVASFFFALSYVARKWHSTLLNNREITTIILFLAFFILSAVSIGKGDGIPSVSWSGELLLVICLAGIFNILNLLLTNYGFQHVEAVVASILLNLELLFAILLGLILYNEIPTIRELIGGIIIVTSIIGMNSIPTKKGD